MKKLLYLFLLFPIFLFAQPRYGVEGIPMCWKISGVDSNVTRYVLISTTGSPVQTIAWENASGQVINVDGGYIYYGYCDCAGGGGTDGNGIYGGSGTLPNALVQAQNTQGIKFVQPGSSNGTLIANKANGAAGVALDPAYTDSIRQGLIWNMGSDSAAVGIDKDGKLQLVSNNWVTVGNDQAKIIIRKDDAIVLIKTGNSVYGLADGAPLAGKNNVMLWPNSNSGRFANLDSLVDGRAKRDTFITVPPNTNYFQNIIDNPARFYNNIYLSCKGRTDTSIVAFLGVPVFDEQKGVVYNIKNDSGLVAAFVITNEHFSNSKRLYLLKRGQTAQVRLLPDAANAGQYGWAVNVVWDSIGDGNGIISALPLGNVNINANNNYLALSNLFGLGIGRIPTGSKLEVAGDGEFHGRGNGILYAGSYPGTGAPDPSVANTGFLYNTNSQFGLLSGPGFSLNTEMILHVNKNQKVTIRGIGDTLPGIGITLSRSTFIRDKLLIGPDSSFIHNPNTDTTFTKGTAVFGKASSLGSPTATGYSHIFRHPSSSSTAVLIESGRVSPTGGSAGVRFLPSGLWSAQIEYGSATSNALVFYSHKLGRSTLFLGSSGFVAGSPRTIIVGLSDDPSQWNGNAGFVVYDTITSGKALMVVKKISTSSVPIATFSSGANDRMTVEDDGDIKIGSGAANAKLHVSGDCIVESTIWLNSTKTVGIFSGTGSPEGVVTASVSSVFHRTNGGAGTSYYVKETGSGNTGWVAK